MRRIITAVLIIHLLGCSQKETNHPVFHHYPPNDIFEEGFVNKYYRHNYPKNQDAQAVTQVTYSKFRKEKNRITIERYNAGFELAGITELQVSEDGDITTEKLIDIYREDTVQIEIINPVSSSWLKTQDVSYKTQFTFGDKRYQFTEKQISISDSTIEGKPAKIFVKASEYFDEKAGEITNQYTDTTVYLAGIGFYESKGGNERYQFSTELIEQMSVDEFQRRADHGEHRVAYIDPSNTLSGNEDFTICGHEKFIADYYNSTPDGRYMYNKRAMMDTIFMNLNRTKLSNQSGSLVFRFVVNCEGKAGRFIAEGYDTNYRVMDFKQETIDHLYGLLQRLENWRPVVIRDEARDAYFYITFKIDNGEIIDILP